MAAPADAREKILQRGVIRRVPGEHLVGQREALRRDDQCDQPAGALCLCKERIALSVVSLMMSRNYEQKCHEWRL